MSSSHISPELAQTAIKALKAEVERRRMVPKKPDTADKKLAQDAEQETVAQLAIIRALAPMSSESRHRIMTAAMHLMDAEKLVPGILRSLVKGQE